MSARRSPLPLAFVALLLVASCTGRQKVEDTLPKEALPVHAQLPGDAALLVRLTSSGVRELQGFVRSLGADPSRALVNLAEAEPSGTTGTLERTGPVVLVAATQLLHDSSANEGLDLSRPVFAALWSMDADRLLEAASLGLPPEPADRPERVSTTLLFPVSDGAKWTEHLRRWWSAKPMAQVTEAQFTHEGPWVRMVLSARWPTVGGDQVPTKDERPAPPPTRLRLTPALASFLAEPADLAIHFPLERVRALVVAERVLEADDRHPSVPLAFRLRAAADAARAFQALDPSLAEVEDLVLRFDAHGGEGFTLDGLSTLTERGQRLSRQRTSPPEQPKLQDAHTLATLTIGSLNEAAVLAPTAVPWLEKESRVRDEALLAVLARSPQAAARALIGSMKDVDLGASSGLLGAQVQVYPSLGGSGESGALPRVVALLSFDDEAGADRVADALREATKGSAASLVRVERPATAKGAKPLVAVGMLAVPQELTVEGGARAKLPEGVTLTVQAGVLDLLGAPMLERLGTLQRLLRQGPLALQFTPEDTVGRFSLRIGKVAEARPSPTPRFEALVHPAPSDPACHNALGTVGISLMQQLGAGAPSSFNSAIDAAYGEVDTLQARCAADGPAGAGAASARGRLGRLREVLAKEERKTPPAPAVAPRPEAPRVRLLLPDGAPVKGAPDAKVTLVMFSDFECPFCVRAEATMKTLEDRYGKDLRFVFLNLPLGFHPNAEPAAKAALAAHAQGRFWEYKALLFEDIRSLGDEALVARAQKLGLDVARFNRDRASDAIDAQVKRDVELARKFGALGTPTFFVNGRKVVGAQPADAFATFIDAELARANRMLEEGVPRAQLYERLVADGVESAEAPPQPTAPKAQPVPEALIYRHVPLPDGATTVHGLPNALVTVVEFVSYQCPFCARAEPTMRAMEKKYGAHLRRVIVHQPLPFHRNSPAASKVVMLASQRKKGPQAHALLMENNRALGEEELPELAGELGIDRVALEDALDSELLQEALDDQIALAAKVGASGTPTFFINGRMIVGAQPEHVFDEAIAQELERARAALKKGVPRAKLYERLSTGP